PSTSGRRPATPRARAPPAPGRRGTASRRTAPRRAPAADRLLVPRDEQRTSFRNSRPRRDLDDGADGARAGGGPYLAQALVEPLTELRPLGAHELELVPPGGGQLDELEPEPRHRRRQLGQLRPERSAEPVALGRGIAKRRRPRSEERRVGKEGSAARARAPQ